MCLGELGENSVSQWILDNTWKWIKMVLWHLGQSTLQLHTSQILRTTVLYYRLWRDTFVLLYLWIYTFKKKKKREPAK